MTLSIEAVEPFTVSGAIDEIGALSFENYSEMRSFIDFEESDNDYGYLVIYSYDPLSKLPPPYNLTEYKDALEPLMDYREDLGFDIFWQSLHPTNCTPVCVKNYIDSYLANYNIRYIILLGDLIPSYPLSISSSSNTDYTILSDSYYLYDYRAYLPAYAIGRFPGGPGQIAELVEKTLDYEEYNPTGLGGFSFNDIVLLAHEDDNDVFKEDCEAVVSNSYSCNLDFTEYYRDDGYIQSSDIRNTIESIVGAVSYHGHGGITNYCWDVPGFKWNDDIMALSNDFYPVVFNIACNTGHYFNENCNAEAWLNDGNGGSCGVWAADCESFITPNSCMHEFIYQYNYNAENPRVSPSVARMALYASYYTVYIFQGTENAWANFFMYKWFGDPGLRLWTNESAPGRLGYAPIDFSEKGSESNSETLVLEELSIYPNPASTSVSFSLNVFSSTDVRVDVYDLQGRIVGAVTPETLTTGLHSLTWEIPENIPQGAYLARVTAANGDCYSRMLTILP